MRYFVAGADFDVGAVVGADVGADVGAVLVAGVVDATDDSARSRFSIRSRSKRSSRSSRAMGVHMERSRGARGSSFAVTSVEKLPSERVYAGPW